MSHTSTNTTEADEAADLIMTVLELHGHELHARHISVIAHRLNELMHEKYKGVDVGQP